MVYLLCNQVCDNCQSLFDFLDEFGGVDRLLQDPVHDQIGKYSSLDVAKAVVLEDWLLQVLEDFLNIKISNVTLTLV